MAELSSLELTAGVAVVSTALAAFSTFCPPVPDVLHDPRTTGVRKSVDFGQNAGALATLSVGVVLAFVARSPIPLVVAILVAFGVSFAYEFAFRRVV